MSNKSVSDFVAATMDAVLKSEAHQSLFGSQYKTAQTMAEKMCAKCHMDKDSCMCDASYADDNDAKKKESKESSSDSSSADDNAAKKKKEESSSDSSSSDSSSADDNAAKKKKEESSSDSSSADDNDAGTDPLGIAKTQPGHSPLINPLNPSVAFDVAIDSLLTASAALDKVGMEQSSIFSLKLASLVVEAKKKDSDKKKSDMKKKMEEKKKKDMQSAKDKAAKEKEKAAKEKAKEKADKEKAKEKAEKEKAKASKKS